MLRPRSARLLAPALLALPLALLGACERQAPEPGVDAARTHFTVRGRWPADAGATGLRITYRAARGTMPVAEADWLDAVERACAAWTATGCVTFAPAATGQDADVTLRWRRGHHGNGEAFGIAKTVAQAGPVAKGTFVHFDADRSWVSGDAEGKDVYSIYTTALHELGHVLGLGHSGADDAVMQTGDVRSMPLATSDVYGLQSLYGGGRDAAGDVRVLRADGTPLCTLRGVAPIGKADVACFDIDGDGSAELVTWRTDADGNGVLQSYHFDERGLIRTTGPYFAMAATAEGSENGVTTADGYRLFVSRFANGRIVARRFDDDGLLVPHTGEGLQWPEQLPTRGDVDGDGAAETIERVTGA